MAELIGIDTSDIDRIANGTITPVEVLDTLGLSSYEVDLEVLEDAVFVHNSYCA